MTALDAAILKRIVPPYQHCDRNAPYDWGPTRLTIVSANFSKHPSQITQSRATHAKTTRIGKHGFDPHLGQAT